MHWKYNEYSHRKSDFHIATFYNAVPRTRRKICFVTEKSCRILRFLAEGNHVRSGPCLSPGSCCTTGQSRDQPGSAHGAPWPDCWPWADAGLAGCAVSATAGKLAGPHARTQPFPVAASAGALDPSALPALPQRALSGRLSLALLFSENCPWPLSPGGRLGQCASSVLTTGAQAAEIQGQQQRTSSACQDDGSGAGAAHGPARQGHAAGLPHVKAGGEG